MEPRIQAQTKDGVSITFHILGERMPLGFSFGGSDR